MYLTPMDDLDARVVRVDTAIAEIDDYLFRNMTNVVEKNAVCSSCADRMYPSYGFPGKVRAPSRCVTAILAAFAAITTL